jgi:hypothetical protein
MPQPNLGALRAVADRLDQLELSYAFVGGSVVSFLVDHPELSPARPTDDVDVILKVVTSERYSDVEERLRRVGFEHDTRENAPRCRWTLGGVTVDIMPTEEVGLGLNTSWFPDALATATECEIAHTRLRLVSPVAFLATKYVAFSDRGGGDFYASHDLEDFITVIDGRKNIATEVDAAPAALRGYVIESVRILSENPAFQEALPGHLPGDAGSQSRLSGLRGKLRTITALALG